MSVLFLVSAYLNKEDVVENNNIINLHFCNSYCVLRVWKVSCLVTDRGIEFLKRW